MTRKDEHISDRTGSADRKTRRDGDTVHHTTRGVPYHGNENEPPRGLTAEQAEAQRAGWKSDERETREAAHGQNQSTAWEADETKSEPAGGSEELTTPPYGKQNRR